LDLNGFELSFSWALPSQKWSPEMDLLSGKSLRNWGKKTIAGNKGADGGDNQRYIDIIGAPS